MNYLILNIFGVLLFSTTTFICVEALKNGIIDFRFGNRNFSIYKSESRVKFDLIILLFFIGNTILLSNSIYNLLIDVLYLIRK